MITRFVFNLRMEEALVDAVQKGHWLPGAARRLKLFVAAVKAATKEHLVDRLKSLKDKVVGRMRDFANYLKRKFSKVTDKTVDEVLAEEMENADFGAKEQVSSLLVDREYVPRWLLSDKVRVGRGGGGSRHRHAHHQIPTSTPSRTSPSTPPACSTASPSMA